MLVLPLEKCGCRLPILGEQTVRVHKTTRFTLSSPPTTFPLHRCGLLADVEMGQSVIEQL